MANYIGKIAAVVTANVSDVAPKLSASAREWDKYGKRVQASVDAARRNARSSFDQIFTAQQRLERAFAAARNTTLKIDLREGEDAIRRLIGASEELARPLVSAQKQFSSLSSSIQNEFGRALSEAQNAARSAAAAITETGRLGEQSFERYKRRVDEAVVSIRRLSEANAAVGGLATGRELRFQQAGFAAELQRTSALQSQASALPADARASGAVAQLVELQRREAEEAARLLAVLESVRNTRRGDAAAAQANLDAQIQRQRLVNDQLERQISLSNAAKQARSVRDRASASETRAGGGFASLEEAQRGADGLFSRIERLGPQAFRSLAGEIDGLASAFATGFIGPVNNDFQRLLSRVRELESETRRFTLVQQRPRSQGLGLFGSQVGSDEERAIARARRVSAEFAQLPESAQAGLQGLAGIASRVADGIDAGTSNATQLLAVLDRLEPAVAAASQFRPIQGNATGQFGPTRDDSPESVRAREIRTRLGAGVADPTRQFAVLEGNIVRLKGEIAELPEPIRARFVPAIERATNELIRLQNSPRATGREIDAVATRVENLRRTAQRASTALNLSSAAQVIDNAGLRAATGQIEAAQRVLVQVGDTAGGPVAQAYQRLVRQTQIFVAEGTIGTERARQQLSRLGEEVARTAAATGRIRLGTALREIQRGGDIARGAFGNAGLAIQQAAFAVDDFFSVTGGLDQRIRAAGNNLSQLGFILGSTQGLFAGIGISIGAQVIASLIRLAPIVRQAEAQQQRFAAEIANANNALERQQQIAERLATAYRALGDSIAESGFSEEGRTASGRAGRLRDIAQIQGEQRGVIAEQASVGVQRLSAIRSDFERRLQDATDPAVATTFRNAAQSVQRDIVSFVRDVENSATEQLRRARAAGGNVDRGLAADLEAATARRTAAIASQASAGGIGRNPAVDRLVDETDRLVAALTIARQRLQDEAAIDRAGVAQAVGDSLGRIQSAVSGVSGFTDVAQRANESASRLRQLIQDSTERPVDALIEQLGRFSRTLEEVAIATSSFSDSLDRAAGNLAREVETELTSRAERARREANQVESRFGGGDRRAVVARFGEEQARDAAAAQTRNRRAIEEEINRLRGQFEAAAFAGLGRGAGGQQAVDIARQIQELRQIAADTTRSAETRQSATLEVDALQRRLSDLFDALPEAAALRRRADQGDIEAQRRQRSLELAARGGDLARSPAQQFSEELADGIAAIREFYSQLAEATTGVVDFASQNQAIQRLVEQSQIDLLRTPAEQAAAQLQQQFSQIAAVQQGLGRAGLADQGAIAARGDAARRRAILGITDIGLSEQQRFARQLESNLGDLEAEARGFLQIGDRQAAAAAVANGQRTLARQNAPLFAQFSDEVANAVLQGPSRAALQVSDASTTEGQRELNRLLRGDDSARDVNLVELQKQSTFLQSIDSGISTLKERLGIAQ